MSGVLDPGTCYMGLVTADGAELRARIAERGWFDPYLRCGEECACRYADEDAMTPWNRVPQIARIGHDDTGSTVTVLLSAKAVTVHVPHEGDIGHLMKILDDNTDFTT